jgi:hypothetical protein
MLSGLYNKHWGGGSKFEYCPTIHVKNLYYIDLTNSVTRIPHYCISTLCSLAARAMHYFNTNDTTSQLKYN